MNDPYTQQPGRGEEEDDDDDGDDGDDDDDYFNIIGKYTKQRGIDGDDGCYLYPLGW